jgi:hypothetical protein
MKYVFHPEAEVEFVAAIDYYEDCEPGLGYDFVIEVHSTLIIYAVDEEVLFILAVMHLHRDPEYWKDRLK